MAAVQTTINFPARKKISISKREKENACNRSTCNKFTSDSEKSPLKVNAESNFDTTTPPKRRSSPESSSCSPSKVQRNDESPSQLISNIRILTPEAKNKSDIEPKSMKVSLFPETPDCGVRKALHRGNVSSLPGREDKIEELTSILLKHLSDRKSCSIYISGQPGTGKTASLNYITELDQISSGYKTVYINCLGLKSSNSIFSAIANKLGVKSSSAKSEKAYQTAIIKHFSTSKKMHLLVLDEQDELVSKGQQVLYSVLEWVKLVPNGLVMVGIANCLDLIDRALPRLSQLSLKPILIHFSPYSAKQISDIIIHRLQQAGSSDDMFEVGALHLLASKIATVSGDVRRALDIATKVVQEADEKISVSSVLMTFSGVYSTSETLKQSEDNFPLQQKIVVCSLMLLRTKSNKKDTTVGKLHHVYKKVCDRKNIMSIDMTEFISLLQLIEAIGIVKLQGKIKNKIMTKVVLQWDEREVVATLKDKELLASIINDPSYL